MLLVTTPLVAGSEPSVCAQSFADMWESQVLVGERAFLVDEAYAPAPGWDMRVMCHAKGTNGKIMDPYMDVKLHANDDNSAMFWLFSRQSCSSQLVGSGIEADFTNVAARVCDAGSGDSGSGSGVEGLDSRRELSEAQCGYPLNEQTAASNTLFSSYTGLGTRHWPEQSGWYGPLMNVRAINGASMGEGLNQTHQLVATESSGASSGFACYMETGGSDAGDGFATEEERVKEERLSWYTGGVMGTVQRDSFTMRSFHFSNDTTKAAAKAAATDSINPGLQYAKTYTGRNGCDVEVVLEFKPQAGGGLEIEVDLGLESMAKETEAALRASVKTYATEDEVIVLAGLKEIREGQFVEALPCEEGVDVEIIRFSKKFVCKATGAMAEAGIAFRRADDQHYDVTTSLLRYQTEPPTATTYDSDGITTRMPGFRLTLSTVDAPESCETLYWDPILAAVTFDTMTSAEEPDEAEDDGGGMGTGALIGAIAGGVAVVGGVAALAYVKLGKKAGGKVPQGAVV